MFVRCPRGGLGEYGGGPGRSGAPQAQLVFVGWPLCRESQSMLSTPLQLNSPAQPAAVHCREQFREITQQQQQQHEGRARTIVADLPPASVLQPNVAWPAV